MVGRKPSATVRVAASGEFCDVHGSIPPP
jgi:hypothetical protein